MRETNLKVATPARFERATYGLEVRCSIQLSYGALFAWVISNAANVSIVQCGQI